MKSHVAARAALLLLLFAVSCGAPTEMLTSWKNPAAQPRTFSKLVVLGVSDNLEARKAVETEISDRLKKEGVRAEPGVRVFPPGYFAQKPSEEDLVKFLKEQAADGILVITVLDVKEKVAHVPGQTSYQPRQEYEHFYGYWSTVYEQVNTPGYTNVSRDIYLQSNLYDLTNPALLWSGESLTGNPQSVNELARSFGSSLVDSLMDEEVLLK